MKIIKLKEDEGQGYFLFPEVKDVEFVNPIEHFSEKFIALIAFARKELILSNSPPPPVRTPLEALFFEDFLNDMVIKQCLSVWEEEYQKILKTEIPSTLISLLNAKSKKEQVRLLKGLNFSTEQISAFTFKAYLDFGYTYSSYRGEHLHKGLNEADLPKLISIKENKITKIGDTILTDGQLKQVVQQRKVIVSRFLDKGDCWHCFFATYASLKGEENWKDGQPHFHYISDKFGMSREKVVAELKSNNYQLGTLPHIDFLNYNTIR